jgi:hypothetical protein
MSDAPRTDAAVRECDGKWSYVLRDCSRELERELAAAQERIRRLEEAGDILSRYIKNAPYALSDYMAQEGERKLRTDNWIKAKEAKL